MPVAIADGGDTVPPRKDKIRRRIPEKDKEESKVGWAGASLRLGKDTVHSNNLQHSTAHYILHVECPFQIESRKGLLI